MAEKNKLEIPKNCSLRVYIHFQFFHMQLNSMLIPKHVAIVMDGNGRWANTRGLSRDEGHRAGAIATRKVVTLAAEQGVKVLTLFAFGNENWQRPKEEVELLMHLFLETMQSEIDELHENQVQFQVIGDRSRVSKGLQIAIQAAEELTKNNTGLKLILAVSYSGRWDLVQATKKIAHSVKSNELSIDEITEETIAKELSTCSVIDPDLFIRTSGEGRISNFLLWQLAYTEFYYTDICWPDFGEEHFAAALNYFATRERRYGCVSEQPKKEHA